MLLKWYGGFLGCVCVNFVNCLILGWGVFFLFGNGSFSLYVMVLDWLVMVRI